MNQIRTKKISILTLSPIMFSFFVMGFVDIVGTAVGYVKKDFGINDTMSNLLPMMVFLWFAICSIPVGLLMRRIGRKKTVLLSAIVTVFAMLLPFIGYTFTIMLCAFALLGIGNTILQVSLNPLVASIVDSKKITSTLTFGMFVKAISSALGPVILAFAATRFNDWKLVFAVYAVATAISFIWLMFTSIKTEKETSAAPSGIKVVLSLLKERTIFSFFLIIVMIVGFEVGLMATVPKYFADCGLTLEDGSYANTLYFIARTIGTFCGAMILSRVSNRKFLNATVATGILSLIVFMSVSGSVPLYSSLFVVGLMCANVFPIIFSQAIQYKSEYADEISSLMIVGVGGGALLPPIMGAVADFTNLRISLIVPVIALITILSISLLILKKKQ